MQFAGGVVRISGQNVSVSLAGNANAVELVVDRDSGYVHSDGVYRNIARLNHAPDFLIVGNTLALAAIADHKDDAAPCLSRAFGQIIAAAQTGFIEDVRFAWRGGVHG